MRQRIREMVEGKLVTTVMTLLTLFALFGDDFRLWFAVKDADSYFFAILTVSFILFFFEIMINSGVQDDFKYSFFFWLDIIATVSLLPDIEFIVLGFEALLGLKPSSAAVDAIPGNLAVVAGADDKLTKVIKSLRLIRLIRIIKLYKYLVKSNSAADEAKMRE